jgi:hypothetical protein
MSENRCPNCEALMVELDCLECVVHSQYQNAVRVMDQRLANLPPPTRSHCRNGHEMTEANTRIDVRADRDKQSVTRVCRACHNARGVARREREKTTQPREPGKLDRGRVAPTGRMTPQTLPVEEQT